MPRIGIQKFDTTPVQGEGSYVKIRGRKMREVEAFNEATQEVATKEKGSLLIDDILSRVVEWNWVDDDGNPLPLPTDKTDIRNDLYEHEIAFLVRLAAEQSQGALEMRKSSPT